MAVETSPIEIDTSASATDTIDYVATDQTASHRRPQDGNRRSSLNRPEQRRIDNRLDFGFNYGDAIIDGKTRPHRSRPWPSDTT